MAHIEPFVCIRPRADLADKVAALPYDVYSREEARLAAQKEPLSFLNIDRPETQFAPDIDMYAPEVYEKARDLLAQAIADGIFLTDMDRCYYLYELTMNGRVQTGIVACAAVDDYLNQVIKKHENTREEKEQDRIRHVDTCGAQTGPIFLAYRTNAALHTITMHVKETEPLYAFTSEDAVTHRVWKVAADAEVAGIHEAFASINQVYIADGHHRAASAVKAGLKRREAGAAGDAYNYFLSVLFPEEDLKILPYNRVVRDLNGLSKEAFLAEAAKSFVCEKRGQEAVAPKEKCSFGMYLDGEWYELTAKEALRRETDPVAALDVSILQNYLLEPVLGISDPRTDQRIDFIGGIRGLQELERRVALDMRVAFSMYPTSISELFAVSDEGRLMPPKSTWFEPKLRSGLFIHQI